jgi:hypothetical protein
MAFSAGASNVANAIAPLYANDAVTMTQGVLLAGAAIGLGAFTIARRTLDTVGNDLTELPILAALIVEVVAGSLITFLSVNGIPASLAASSHPVKQSGTTRAPTAATKRWPTATVSPGSGNAAPRARQRPTSSTRPRPAASSSSGC